jgi:hypothetical protein
MLYLRRKKSIVHCLNLLSAFLFSLLTLSATAQKEIYLEEHDAKPYYFGITLAANMASFQTHLHSKFLNQDSILVAEPLNSGGFALGLLATARLSPRFEARFNPQLSFAERTIAYTLSKPDLIEPGLQVNKTVESVIVTFPLQVKFRSDRIGNFRVYMLGGGKLDYDLASNAQARKAEDMIKIEKMDYGIEAGMGFNFYFKSFIFSPEVKISNGLRNMHARDENLKYSSVIDRIQSRMVVFSIHLEG